MNTEGYVYRIIAPGSNSVYVGQSVNPEARFKKHKRCPQNPALAHFLKKHSDAEIYFWPVLDMDAEEIADEQLCRKIGFNLLNCIPCGSKPPNLKGRKLGPHSAEHREALRVAQNNPETNARRSASLTGLKRTHEQRAKMSASQQGRVVSAETRAKMSAAHLGIPRSAETIAKMRTRQHSPETKEKMRAAHLGRKHTAERCTNMSKAMTGKLWSPARRAAHERKVG